MDIQDKILQLLVQHSQRNAYDSIQKDQFLDLASDLTDLFSDNRNQPQVGDYQSYGGQQ